MTSLNLKTLPSLPVSLPNLPARHLPRQHLVDLLLKKSQRLRLLCAPAGFGKSTLLCETLRQLPQERTAWIPMSGQWLTIGTFCQQIGKAFGVAPAIYRDTDALLSWFSQCEETLRLVLDDYPSQGPDPIGQWLDQLLGLPGSALQVFVSCRQRPQLNLSRLLLEDELLELDSRQLAFSRDEFEQLMGLLAPNRCANENAMLWQQSLGWCAATRLLCEASQQQGSVWLREYLQHEVLSRLTERQVSILSALAHLPKFNAALYAHLWDDENGTAAFELMLRTNAYFHVLDAAGQWYCLLPAIANALRDQLQGAALNQLRLRACHWLSAAGCIDDAIELALCAGQPDLAANLMDRLGFDWLFARQHLNKWLGWYDRMPPSLLLGSPRLIFQSARALLLSWRLDEAHSCIARLERFLPHPDPVQHRRLIANWQALYGSLEGLRGHAQTAGEHCRQALAHLSSPDWRSAILCHSTLGRVEMATGNSQDGRQLLQDAVEIARRHGCLANEVLINTDRIRQAILSDELAQAEILLNQSLELTRADTRPSLLLGRLHLLQGELHLLRGAASEAEKALELGMSLARESADPFKLHGYVGLSEVAARQGDFDQASRAMHDAERHMHCQKAQASCYQMLLDYQRLRLLVHRGEWQAIEPIALAMEALLDPGSGRIAPLHTPSLPLRIQLLLALAQRGLGRADEARKRLLAMLEHCERFKFNALAREARVLLETIEGQGQGDVPSANPAAAKPSRFELSSRELSVLNLLATGLTNQEIGDNLFISLNTVKAHTKSINAKLGVKRRALAVMRAQEMGLLAP
ncbi:LuxR C-terminal-related transcriptional regulator [Pseudomonas sp. NPDC090755]|uniref:LuxR C-terminal-related transcriptional regulator n=1 Tax=Pseudomonas sp. NPDC090755 TaxID=3364481 RepID=UPI00383B1797